MTDLYVIGGRAKPNRRNLEEWHGYESGLILRLNSETGAGECVAEYVSPPETCPDDQPSITFKAGTLSGDRLHVCTQTEVLTYRLRDFRRQNHISLPIFNDVHHVLPTDDDGYLVAVTGLDMVAELGPDGAVRREWGVLGNDTWERFSREIDYRKVPTTKPHRSHPNFVFRTGSDIWVTRHFQRDAICLTNPDRRIDIGVGGPHDGLVVGDRVYFTTVDGAVVRADVNTGAVEKLLSANDIVRTEQPLGWCRGIQVLDERHVLVGFSRIRQTRFRDNVQWVKDRLKSLARYGQSHLTKPTRISCFDIERKALCWDFNLEDFGMNAVFSIHSADTAVSH